jgi:hypothetical protein
MTKEDLINKLKEATILLENNELSYARIRRLWIHLNGTLELIKQLINKK